MIAPKHIAGSGSAAGAETTMQGDVAQEASHISMSPSVLGSLRGVLAVVSSCHEALEPAGDADSGERALLGDRGGGSWLGASNVRLGSPDPGVWLSGSASNLTSIYDEDFVDEDRCRSKMESEQLRKQNA
ncbi:hypothetical protein GGTG_10966 [Gaeumannomyces tritici R3-111a-1]|uniref:Uncharacterized protein n=1 Tax=Gaeumannomyces tritici (strain R3-111a-1) TaxID=644352 RepID=J3PBU4_GAET3|nr:hypothetical protein GGTG_10966 [Gaeumannomyces tritici R3-111a-1]EJT71712.1 hypothetical protein GGTG_10966 [Gaeumannomyces tritici R3-111a-1]